MFALKSIWLVKTNEHAKIKTLYDFYLMKLIYRKKNI